MIIVDDIQKGYDRSGEVRIWASQGSLVAREGIQAYVGVSCEVKRMNSGYCS